MSDSQPGPRDDSPQQPGPVRRWPRRGVLAVLLVLVAAVVAGLWWAREQAIRPSSLLDAAADAPSAVVDLPRAGDRSVVVVFPRGDGAGWTSEQRRLPSRGQPGEDLMALMQTLCDGPQSGRAVSALPPGTRALAAFIDPRRGSAILDFSRELVSGHPGGSAAEIATVGSILRTVALNFPQVGACTILVDGRQVGTLAGHLDLAHPFVPRRWL